MGKITTIFYEIYKPFAVVLFILQNCLLFLTLLASYPNGKVLITTNTKNEMWIEIFWTGFLVISSILFGIIFFVKRQHQESHEIKEMFKIYRKSLIHVLKQSPHIKNESFHSLFPFTPLKPNIYTKFSNSL